MKAMMKEAAPHCDDENALTVAFVKATRKCFRITTGKEILEVLSILAH
jgi:hypothetical protein